MSGADGDGGARQHLGGHRGWGVAVRVGAMARSGGAGRDVSVDGVAVSNPPRWDTVLQRSDRIGASFSGGGSSAYGGCRAMGGAPCSSRAA